MKFTKTLSDRVPFYRLALILLLFLVGFSATAVQAQLATTKNSTHDSPPNAAEKQFTDSGFRVEKVSVAGGSEVVTIFAKQGASSEIPLVSFLRDTLGDDKPENDRLRYVWMHTYTRASFRQRAAAFVPFLYTRTSNKKDVGTGPPPVVIDVQQSSKALWASVFWIILKKLVINDLSVGFRASAYQYHQNSSDYKKSAVAAALTVLSLYQEAEGENVISDKDLKDIQARLFLSDKTFGWHMQSENLGRVYQKETEKARDYRGHNWELLRQYSEAQGLYFEPIEMPDGTARHAIVWTSVSDIATNRGKSFNHRFLNFRNPWVDKNLANWKGYTQIRWYDADDREVEPDTPNAKPRTMIPLALYGLDNPKIPMILIDFRDNGNPKFREMSKRILNDVTTNVLQLSKFSSFPYFFGRFIYEFIPGRRGLDLNQTSRVRSYSQLKLLLSLENEIEPELRQSIAKKIEHATLNPMENDADVEATLARTQYANLMAYSKDPDGLAAKVLNDRREEMVRLNHGGLDRAYFGVAHALSLGLYTHREKDTPEMVAKMDMRRQLDYHERFLRETAFASADPEIDSNVD